LLCARLCVPGFKTIFSCLYLFVEIIMDFVVFEINGSLVLALSTVALTYMLIVIHFMCCGPHMIYVCSNNSATACGLSTDIPVLL
jgi:hypothetical protein